MSTTPTITVHSPGDSGQADPFTVCLIANPALEAPWNSGTFIPDPILSDQALFDEAVAFTINCLCGDLPGQGERLLGPHDIRAKVRIISIFAPCLPANDANSLVAQDGVSNLLVARRVVFRPFLATLGLDADIGFAYSDSASHTRSTAWPTTDDDSRSGQPFLLDGVPFFHRHFASVPGTVAQYVRDRDPTPLHEFQHALGSYSNGQILDLYVDSSIGVNNKRGRPIPESFVTYEGVLHSSDPTRDGLGYPVGWSSYHCELHRSDRPSVMDDYTAVVNGLECENDTITRQFLQDRLRAKCSR